MGFIIHSGEASGFTIPGMDMDGTLSTVHTIGDGTGDGVRTGVGASPITFSLITDSTVHITVLSLDPDMGTLFTEVPEELM